MSKTNEQILSKVPNLTFSEIENCDLYTESQVLIAMTAAREDEREKIREMIQKRIDECNKAPLMYNMTIEILTQILYDLSCT